MSKKEWCRHIELKMGNDPLTNDDTYNWYILSGAMNVWVEDEWKVCPICLVPRPKND